LDKILDDVEAQVAAMTPKQQQKVAKACREVSVKYGL